MSHDLKAGGSHKTKFESAVVARPQVDQVLSSSPTWLFVSASSFSFLLLPSSSQNLNIWQRELMANKNVVLTMVDDILGAEEGKQIYQGLPP